MATGTGMTRESVKAACDQLECSPSKNSRPAASGGKPSLTRHTSSSVAGSKKTSKLQKAFSGVPGYGGRFARGARQE